MKTCCKCKVQLPLEQFVKNTNSKDGHHSTCKACIKEYQDSVREKLKEYQREYQAVYQKENKEALEAYKTKWRQENIDKVRVYAKKSMSRPEAKAKQRAYMKEYNKLWRKNNPEKWKASVDKYNAKQKLKRQNEQQQ
jgi:hypothetical protein